MGKKRIMIFIYLNPTIEFKGKTPTAILFLIKIEYKFANFSFIDLIILQNVFSCSFNYFQKKEVIYKI